MNTYATKLLGGLCFVFGFLLMVWLGFTKMSFWVKVALYISLFAGLIILAFLIYYFKTHDLGYNAYNKIMDEGRSKRINQGLIKLGVEKHTINVIVNDNSVKVTIRHNGYLSYMLVEKSLITLGYEANNDYIRLPDEAKAKADNLIDNVHSEVRGFKKYSVTAIYSLLVDFDKNN